MTWEELLKDQKWQLFYTCNCKGGKRLFFNNESYTGFEIRVNISRGTFAILKNNYIIEPTGWLYELNEQMLNKHEIFSQSVQKEG